MFLLFLVYGIASVHFFYFIVVMKFADIVAVIIDDIDNDCFLKMISWLFKYRSLCSVQLLSCPSHSLRGRSSV